MVNKAYDIRTTDSAYQKKLEVKYQVKITKTDDKFYEDFYHGEPFYHGHHVMVRSSSPVLRWCLPLG